VSATDTRPDTCRRCGAVQPPAHLTPSEARPLAAAVQALTAACGPEPAPDVARALRHLHEVVGGLLVIIGPDSDCDLPPTGLAGPKSRCGHPTTPTQPE
jgi:hypothetical protein